MDYTRDDVTKIIGAYAIALQERRLQFSGPQRLVLEEVLLRELCGLEDTKRRKEEEKSYGIALIQKLGSSSITVVIREHARILYGQDESLRRYTEDNLLGLYQQALGGIYQYSFHKLKAGISRKIPLEVNSLCILERYFVNRGRITETRFIDLRQRKQVSVQNKLLRQPAVKSEVLKRQDEKILPRKKKTVKEKVVVDDDFGGDTDDVQYIDVNLEDDWNDL